MSKKYFLRLRLGFTLLELLVVMAIIGVLATIAIVNVPAATKRARDSTRRSDIKQYQTAMEVYYNKNGVYVANSGAPTNPGACDSSKLDLPACVKDPKSGWPNYNIYSTTSNYVVSAKLEQPNDPTKAFFVVCSDGRSGECADPGTATSCIASCP